MTYEQRLIAAGIPPQTARRDAWANEMQWLNNREAERYASERARMAGRNRSTSTNAEVRNG